MAASGALTTERVVSTLGGRRALRSRIDSVDKLHLEVRRGLPYASLESVAEVYEIDLRRLADVLAIPLRTLARRKHDRRLRPDESDRLYRVARIAALADDALGGRDQAVRWLQRPNRALGNAVPLYYLDTELGARRVEDILGRIRHGVYS